MERSKNRRQYDDIIHLPHHTSPKRSRMSAADRAAQFSPFAALTGYDAAVKETARLTQRRIELDEYEKAALDGRFQILEKHLKEYPEVTITYFQPDERKEGGIYRSVTGRVRKIDRIQRKVTMEDDLKISIDEIAGIEGTLFLSCFA